MCATPCHPGAARGSPQPFLLPFPRAQRGETRPRGERTQFIDTPPAQHRVARGLGVVLFYRYSVHRVHRDRGAGRHASAMLPTAHAWWGRQIGGVWRGGDGGARISPPRTPSTGPPAPPAASRAVGPGFGAAERGLGHRANTAQRCTTPLRTGGSRLRPPPYPERPYPPADLARVPLLWLQGEGGWRVPEALSTPTGELSRVRGSGRGARVPLCFLSGARSSSNPGALGAFVPELPPSPAG